MLTELEAKRHHPELGWAARSALRALEELREKHGSLLEGLSVILVSKDLPLRLKAGVLGLRATEFRDTEVSDDGWTGHTDIVVDEAQNLECNVLLTTRVGRYDGIGAVIDHLRGHPLFGHVTLTRSERSEVAALVAGLLDGRD